MSLAIKRVYDVPAAADGYRVLVDRLWPRGVTKARAALDLWLKEVAPSPELRQWFGHDPAKFDDFAQRYEDELAANPAVDQLQQLGREHDAVTLLYGAKDHAINHAVVLRRWLERHEP